MLQPSQPPMDELLDEFLHATDFSTLMNLARDLSVRDDPADVRALQIALADPLEARRYAAVYALGFGRRDKRVTAPLIRILEDRAEAPRVRGRQQSASAMPRNVRR